LKNTRIDLYLQIVRSYTEERKMDKRRIT